MKAYVLLRQLMHVLGFKKSRAEGRGALSDFWLAILFGITCGYLMFYNKAFLLQIERIVTIFCSHASLNNTKLSRKKITVDGKFSRSSRIFTGFSPEFYPDFPDFYRSSRIFPGVSEIFALDPGYIFF